MRSSILLVLLLACDHRPAPKKEPPPPPAVIDAGTAAGSAAAQPVQPPPAGDACVQVGARIAEIIIANTPDPTQKAAYEQDRTKLVKRFADNCQRDSWPETVRTCFLAAKMPADIEACSRDLVKPAPMPRQPVAPDIPAGSGSAAKG